MLAVCFACAVFTGLRLKQVVDVERTLRSQMADLALVASMAPNHPANSTVTLGESSLNGALQEVLHDGHKLEAWLALQAIGIVAGLLMLRSSKPQV